MKKIVSVLLLAVMVCVAAAPVFATEASFTVFTDEEYEWLYYEEGCGNSDGSRYCDGFGFVVYEFPISEGDKFAQLSWRIRNQYQVAVSNTDPDDPDTFEVIWEAQPTDDEIAEGKANWGDYGSDIIAVHDLSKWCENNTTGKIWVQMGDADPTNGWGGYIYAGTPVTFYSGAEPAPEVEQLKTKDELAAEILAQYNFAEGTQAFVVASNTEKPFLYKEDGAINGDNDRFHDGNCVSVYQFDVKAGDTSAILHGSFDNQFDIRVATSDPDNLEAYTPVLVAEPTQEEIDAGGPDWGGRTVAEEILDEEGNLVDTKYTYPIYDIDLSSYLTGKDGKIYVSIGDADTSNGWGGLIHFDYPVVFSTSGKIFADGAAEPAAPVETEAPAEVPAETEAPAEVPAETEAPAEVPAETEAPAEVVAPAEKEEAPQTFDAAVVAVLAAVATLGGAVAFKKKH